MAGLGVSDAELYAQLEDVRQMPEDDQSAEFDEATQDLPDGHLVEYVEECVRHTDRTEDERQKLDEQLWDAHENKQREMAVKEDWQAKITTNEPFQTVTQAKMLVRKAIVDRPEWFSMTTQHKDNDFMVAKASFWEDGTRWWARKAKLHQLFPDMTEMAFAVGTSLASKAVWGTDADGAEGLRMVQIEPWKLKKDPDAISRQPQSGLYCIHQDWIDYHVLLEGEKAGNYINVRNCLHDKGDEGSTDRRQERKKRGLVDYSHKFRPQVFVREFWGGVLDHNGELVYPSVRFTVANRTVISRPVPTNFPRIRWPIHQFAALPHMRNFHGYSLIEGMLKMWKFRNNLISMTADRLSFVLNGAYEVDEGKLVNPADKELYPGCTKAKKFNAQGSAYTPIKTDTEFLPVVEKLMSLTGNLFQNGVFVTELLKGETGERSAITKGEVEIKTQQAMGVFEGIGRDVEYGAEQYIEMIQDVLTTYWDPLDTPSYLAVLGEKHARMIDQIAMVSPEDRVKAVKMDTDIEVRGVSLLFQKAEMVDHLINMVKITGDPRFANYAKDDKMIRKLADVLDSSDVIKTDDELMAELEAARAQIANNPVVNGPAPIGPSPDGQNPHLGAGGSLADKAMAAAGVPATTASQGAPNA
jgi:hypothetical protein